MAIQYSNGGAPDYLGISITSATEIIDHIETILVAAGWTTVTKVAGTSLLIRGVTPVNSYNCWVEFTITGTTPNLFVNMEGWLEEAKINGSGLYTFQRYSTSLNTFTDGSDNRVWITADQDAVLICISSSNGDTTGWHFGFTEHIRTDDQWGIYIGPLNSWNYGSVRVAKLYSDDTNLWFLVGTCFVLAENIGTNVATSRQPMSSTDALCTFVTSNGEPIGDTASKVYEENDPTDIHLAHAGRRNAYTGLPYVRPFFIIEGLDTDTGYMNENNPDNYASNGISDITVRGDIRFAYTGMMGEPELKKIQFPNGQIIMSVGAGDGWQGMLIKPPD